MDREVGQVVKVGEKEMEIMIHAPAGCDSCSAKGVCHAGSSDSGFRIITLPRINGVQPGQQVVLTFRQSSSLIAAMIVFVVPILFALMGYLVATTLFPSSELFGALGLIGGLLISGAVIYFLNQNLSRSNFFLPRVEIQDQPSESPGISREKNGLPPIHQN
ncbi:MAG: SoxR reducing system RseC family protein [Calditrichaeota bacterium]|nr:SoxR reducing system RseC family protein [Calditrichota bacterium]